MPGNVRQPSSYVMNTVTGAGHIQRDFARCDKVREIFGLDAITQRSANSKEVPAQVKAELLREEALPSSQPLPIASLRSPKRALSADPCMTWQNHSGHASFPFHADASDS